MSFPRNAATPKIVTVGSVSLIADGTVQTSGCSVRVQLDSGGSGAGGGTLGYDATSGAVTYAPLQAETNGDVLNIAVYKASCIGCSTTVLMDPNLLAVNASQVGGQTASAAGTVTFPGTIGTSTLTQTQVTGGAYDVTNASCAVHLAADQTVNVTKWGGTAVASAYVQANVEEIHGTSIAGTGTQVASAFVNMFNVASPQFTVASKNQTGDSYSIVNDIDEGMFKTFEAVGAVGLAVAGVPAVTDIIGAIDTGSVKIPAIYAAVTDAGYVLSAVAAAIDGLSLGEVTVGDVTLAAIQPNYAPAKSGDKMDLVNAPNATAVASIKTNLGTVPASGNWLTDKTGFSLATAPPTAAAVATAVWRDVSSTDFNVGSSIGNLLTTALPWYAPGSPLGLPVLTADGHLAADVQTVKLQAVTCAGAITIGAYVGQGVHALTVDSSGNVTAATDPDVIATLATLANQTTIISALGGLAPSTPTNLIIEDTAVVID